MPTNDPPTPKKLSLSVVQANSKVEELRRMPPPQTPAQPTPPSPPKTIEQKLFEGRIIEALRTIYDPEIPVNIHDLGLIYGIDIDPESRVKIRMTLTAPACPVAGALVAEVESKVENIPEVKSATVELVWDPPWDRSRMSEAAQLELGL